MPMNWKNEKRKKDYESLIPVSIDDDEDSSSFISQHQSSSICHCTTSHFINQKSSVNKVIFATALSFCMLLFYVHHSHKEMNTNVNTNNIMTRAENDELKRVIEVERISSVEDVQYGAVATDHKLCSDIGLSILRDKGGNAVDAAVASTLCLGVVNLCHSGIGGGTFILVHMNKNNGIEEDANKSEIFDDMREENSGRIVSTEFIDARETAPGRARFDMFEGTKANTSTDGGLAIAVPGELRGLELVHRRHGTLPWATLVEPAIELAEQGVPLSHHMSSMIDQSIDRIKSNDALYNLLSKESDGGSRVFLEEGDLLVQKQLASTLRLISSEGANALYTGLLAESLANDIVDVGGIISKEDITKYKAVLRDPIVSSDTNPFVLIGAPPPSSGGATIIAIIRFLIGYGDFYSSNFGTLSQHRLVEAMKHAFAMRMSLADPTFVAKSVKEAVKDMVSGSYIQSLRKLTSDENTLPYWVYGGPKWSKLTNHTKTAHGGEEHGEVGGFRRRLRGFQYLNDSGTAGITVVDKDRNAVSLISTINTLFGSCVLSPSTGIILNNEMDDFSSPGQPNYFGLAPSEENYIAPFKRPLSSMAPLIVLKADDSQVEPSHSLFMVLAASGGPKIITAILQTFLNYAFAQFSLPEAIAFPRLHNQLLYHGDTVTLYSDEKITLSQDKNVHLRSRFGIEEPSKIVKFLKSRGHLTKSSTYMGNCQGIAVNMRDGKLSVAADLRKGGIATGY